MGTSYEPPVQRDINVVNEDLLTILEKELNIKGPLPSQMVPIKSQSVEV
jgi:hypothetical protein